MKRKQQRMDKRQTTQKLIPMEQTAPPNKLIQKELQRIKIPLKCKVELILYLFVMKFPETFIKIKMKTEAIVNLAPMEINGVSDSKLALIASQVEPQIRQSKM